MAQKVLGTFPTGTSDYLEAWQRREESMRAAEERRKNQQAAAENLSYTPTATAAPAPEPVQTPTTETAAQAYEPAAPTPTISYEPEQQQAAGSSQPAVEPPTPTPTIAYEPEQQPAATDWNRQANQAADTLGLRGNERINFISQMLNTQAAGSSQQAAGSTAGSGQQSANNAANDYLAAWQRREESMREAEARRAANQQPEVSYNPPATNVPAAGTAGSNQPPAPTEFTYPTLLDVTRNGIPADIQASMNAFDNRPKDYPYSNVFGTNDPNGESDLMYLIGKTGMAVENRWNNAVTTLKNDQKRWDWIQSQPEYLNAVTEEQMMEAEAILGARYDNMVKNGTITQDVAPIVSSNDIRDRWKQAHDSKVAEHNAMYDETAAWWSGRIKDQAEKNAMQAEAEQAAIKAGYSPYTPEGIAYIKSYQESEQQKDRRTPAGDTRSNLTSTLDDVMNGVPVENNRNSGQKGTGPASKPTTSVSSGQPATGSSASASGTAAGPSGKTGSTSGSAGSTSGSAAGTSGSSGNYTVPSGSTYFRPSYGQDMTRGVKAPYRREGYSIEELEGFGNAPRTDFINNNGKPAYEGYYLAPNGKYYPVDQQKAAYYRENGTYNGWNEGMREYYNTFGTYYGYRPGWKNNGTIRGGGYGGGYSYSPRSYGYSSGGNSTLTYTTQNPTYSYNGMKNWSF